MTARPEDTIDLAHLKRFTLGNADLEAEILKLFADQLPVTLGYLRADASPADWKYATHTLKGAARGVGAHQLAAAAAAAEDAPLDDRAGHVAALHAHVVEVAGFVARHLAGLSDAAADRLPVPHRASA